MRSDDDLYEVLELSPRASMEVIRAAYRCLVQHHHPDKNAGADRANERLAQINHAYAVLSDPLKRQNYDRSRGVERDFIERRGMRAPRRTGVHGAAAGGQTGVRPFGFRPFD